MSVRPATRIDVLIVTAVKEEWDAVLAVETGAKPGSSWRRYPEVAGPEVYCRDFVIEGGVLSIGVVQTFAMGREQAVIAAAPLLEKHREIRCLAMCGVCAGRRGETALGDVIIADRTWPYDAGKLKVVVDEQGRRTERFQGDMDLYRIHPPEWKHRAERFQVAPSAAWIKERPRSYEDQGDWVLERLARGEDPTKHADRKLRCPNWDAVLEQLWRVQWLDEGELTLTVAGRKRIVRRVMLEPDGLREPGPFRIVVGPIASGAPVVQDTTIFDRLSDTHAMRKVVGLEMETSAILGLAYLCKVPYSVVMKGVMDHADIFKSDNMKPFAAMASAECLLMFIRENLGRSEDGPRRWPHWLLVAMVICSVAAWIGWKYVTDDEAERPTHSDKELKPAEPTPGAVEEKEPPTMAETRSPSGIDGSHDAGSTTRADTPVEDKSPTAPEDPTKMEPKHPPKIDGGKKTPPNKKESCQIPLSRTEIKFKGWIGTDWTKEGGQPPSYELGRCKLSLTKSRRVEIRLEANVELPKGKAPALIMYLCANGTAQKDCASMRNTKDYDAIGSTHLTWKGAFNAATKADNVVYGAVTYCGPDTGSCYLDKGILTITALP
jgi:nucleoside phosphorylase